jgi:hypothetical protein
LRLAVLKRRKAGDAVLIDGKFSDLMKLSAQLSLIGRDINSLQIYYRSYGALRGHDHRVRISDFKLNYIAKSANLIQRLTRSENIEPSSVSSQFSSGEAISPLTSA